MLMLLVLPVTAPAHEPLWVPVTPAGVSPCELPRVRCPLSLQRIHRHLSAAVVEADQAALDYWWRRLRIWYAFNPDYRHHLHPHR